MPEQTTRHLTLEIERNDVNAPLFGVTDNWSPD